MKPLLLLLLALSLTSPAWGQTPPKERPKVQLSPGLAEQVRTGIQNHESLLTLVKLPKEEEQKQRTYLSNLKIRLKEESLTEIEARKAVALAEKLIQLIGKPFVDAMNKQYPFLEKMWEQGHRNLDDYVNAVKAYEALDIGRITLEVIDGHTLQMKTQREVIALSPTGYPITLPERTSAYDFTPVKSATPFGSLAGFTYDGKTFAAAYDSEDHFLGYYQLDPATGGALRKDGKYSLYVDTRTRNQPGSALVILGVPAHCAIELRALSLVSVNTPIDTLGGVDRKPLGSAGLQGYKERSAFFRKLEDQEACGYAPALEVRYQELLTRATVLASKNGVLFRLEKSPTERYFLYQSLGDDGTISYQQWNGNTWEAFDFDKNKSLFAREYMTLVEAGRLVAKTIREDPVHFTLDALGFVPVVGVVADGVNALIYLAEKEIVAASLSSTAIVVGGVVVARRAYLARKAVKVVGKGAGATTSVVTLSEDYMEAMKGVLKQAESGYVGSPEDWMRLPHHLTEFAAQHGAAGMKALVELSEGMEAGKFLAVAGQIHRMENGADLIADLGKADFAAYLRQAGKDGVDAWKALDNIGVDDAIRKNPGYLKNVDDYATRSGKSADEVADLAKNNENGIEQFLDELEDTPASGHWDENPFDRGKLIEDDLGQNLPETFKTIDKYDDVTGEATSIKSLDLDAKTYQSASKLRSRLNKYLNELDDFDGYQLEGVEIGDIENPINSKTLELAIPRAATGEQLTVINELVSNGASRGINVKIVEFP